MVLAITESQIDFAISHNLHKNDNGFLLRLDGNYKHILHGLKYQGLQLPNPQKSSKWSAYLMKSLESRPHCRTNPSLIRAQPHPWVDRQDLLRHWALNRRLDPQIPFSKQPSEDQTTRTAPTLQLGRLQWVIKFKFYWRNVEPNQDPNSLGWTQTTQTITSMFQEPQESHWSHAFSRAYQTHWTGPLLGLLSNSPEAQKPGPPCAPPHFRQYQSHRTQIRVGSSWELEDPTLGRNLSTELGSLSYRATGYPRKSYG